MRSDPQRSGFLSIEMAIVDYDEPARRKRGKRFPQEKFYGCGIPIVQGVRPQVDIVSRGQRVAKHVAGSNAYALGKAAFGNGLLRDTIHRRLFKDCGFQMWMRGDNAAGVNARSAGNVQQRAVRL